MDKLIEKKIIYAFGVLAFLLLFLSMYYYIKENRPINPDEDTDSTGYFVESERHDAKEDASQQEEGETEAETESYPVRAESGITANLESGFYNKAIDIELSCQDTLNSKAIYYTLNGNDPTEDSEIYESGITLEPVEGLKIYPLKAVVIKDGKAGPVFERTYVLGSDIKEKYGLDIVSITSDEKNLYDYDTGILVPGRLYDENLEAGVQDYIPGNYNSRTPEWLRDAHVSMFTPDGGVVFEKDVDLGISGGTSAAFAVKSLKLSTKTYENGRDKFNITLINDGSGYSYNSIPDGYNTLRLRSGSQDQIYGNIRSAVVSRLANEAGFDGCTTTRRCIVFLNGAYYGIFDMQQSYSNSYLAAKFGLPDSENIEAIKSSEENINNATGLIKYFEPDLDKQENREKLESVVDMDNYLMYYALNVLVNNTDWPGNNYELWRYTGGYDGKNKYTDGRYRYLIFDTDMVYVTEAMPNDYEGFKGDILEQLITKQFRAESSGFTNVINTKYYRDKFVTMVSDLLNTVYTKSNIFDVVDEENAKIQAARKIFYEEDFVNSAESFVSEIKKAAFLREGRLRSVLREYYDLKDTYIMRLKNSEGVFVSWNSMNIFAGEEYTCRYYNDAEFEIEAKAYPGYRFEYWLVNGEKVYEPVLMLSGELVKNSVVTIEAVAKKSDDKSIIISELSAAGLYDWIRLTNVGGTQIKLSEYYLSDNSAKFRKSPLPNVTLAPGESVVVNGSKNIEALGEYYCKFSLSGGETLYLSFDDVMVDGIAVPYMNKDETYGRYDGSPKWVFYDNRAADRKHNYNK
ncbi:MAG: CotH kinase family protein [Lachnospiraceae bacterium]|nr:CotH kinase family protein [Lachnospiraceae bacterium]